MLEPHLSEQSEVSHLLEETFPGLPEIPLEALVSTYKLGKFLREQGADETLLAQTHQIHSTFMSVIANTVKDFADKVEVGISSEDHSLESFMPQSLATCEIILENLFSNDPSRLKDNILKLCSLVLRDLEDAFTLLVNAWLGFFVSDFWTFVELGINELEVFTVYLYEKYKVTLDKYPSLKIFSGEDYHERLQVCISDLITTVCFDLTLDWKASVPLRAGVQRRS